MASCKRSWFWRVVAAASDAKGLGTISRFAMSALCFLIKQTRMTIIVRR